MHVQVRQRKRQVQTNATAYSSTVQRRDGHGLSPPMGWVVLGSNIEI